MGDAIPHPIRPRAAIVQCLWPTSLILIAPWIERRYRDSDIVRVRRTGKWDCFQTSRMISSFSEAGYVMPRPPHPPSRFF